MVETSVWRASPEKGVVFVLHCRKCKDSEEIRKKIRGEIREYELPFLIHDLSVRISSRSSSRSLYVSERFESINSLTSLIVFEAETLAFSVPWRATLLINASSEEIRSISSRIGVINLIMSPASCFFRLPYAFGSSCKGYQNAGQVSARRKQFHQVEKV